jgi:cytochrome P450
MAHALASSATSLPLPAPGPRGRLGVGSLFEAWSDPLTMMLEGFREFGPVATYRFAWVRYLVVADPEAAHRVLVENPKGYEKSPNYQGLKILLGQGLLTAEGDFWRKQRRMAQPAFHRERLAGFVATMAACTRDGIERWRREADGAALDVHREMMRLTFRIVGRTLLSVELDGEAKAVGEALDVALRWANDYVESIVRVPPWIPTPRNLAFRRAQRTLDELVLRIVAERRAAHERGEEVPGDLLQMLLEARDEDTGRGMSDEQLKHELLTLVLAGHETTANALSFALWLLARHPDARARLEREVDEVLAGRPPALADLPRLAWTTQVIEESMRLYPPAWVYERVALVDDVVGGFHVPRGTIVGVAPWVMHRNPTLFPDPERFDPERMGKDRAKERPKHAYLPFGGGPRTCIGNAFAMMEMQIVLAMLAQAYRFEEQPGFQLELEPSVTLRPARGLPMRLVPRR